MSHSHMFSGNPLSDSLAVFFEDNPSFWTGKVNLNNFNVTKLIDYGIAVHPALIGNGAARVTHKAAQNSEGVAYASGPLRHAINRARFGAVDATAVSGSDGGRSIRTDDSNFLRQEDVTLTLH